MEQINLNTIPGIEMYPIIHVSQGDVGRQFKINLYNDEGEVVLDGTESLSITGYKADGNVFVYNLPSVTGSELTISTEEQMTAAKGECICEISVVKDATKIGTANFIMQVEANPSAQGPLSTSALDVIDALLQSAHEDIETAASAASTATTAATNAANSATSAASSASNAASSANNASSYANTANQSATDAASSASSASTSAANAASSASDAASSATSAASAVSSVSADASSAHASATNAETYASNAATSASNASDSATAAAVSASSASDSASSASTSATNAASSESNAATSESNAHDSEVAAAASASSASSSASSASTSATNAAASETKIANMTVSAQSVSYTEEAEVVKTVVGDVYNLDFKIPKGQPMSGHEVIANPSGAPAGGNLTKLGIDGVNYEVSGGSGSIVTVTQIQSSGTKIAEIGVDGNTTDLYAPEGGGSEVIANPSGAPTGGNLTKLGIDGFVYNIASSGSTVQVNPAEMANYYINTLKIDGQIYDIIGKPLKLKDKYRLNPSKLIDYSNNMLADFSGNAQTHNITIDSMTGWKIVFEVYNYGGSFSPLQPINATYTQMSNGAFYAGQITTQRPRINRVTMPVNLGAVEVSMDCLLTRDSKIYNDDLPILVNGNAATLSNLSVSYCADNYPNDGTVRHDGLKLYITADIIGVNAGDTITVDYSHAGMGRVPVYIIEDQDTTTVIYNLGGSPTITNYPTFN